MPYKSKAQAGYFHTHRAELEKQGVDVAEWDAATKGKELPQKVEKASRTRSGYTRREIGSRRRMTGKATR